MTTAREAALEWVRRALFEELRNDPTIPTRAENLVAIAEHNNVEIEELIHWIHTSAPRKTWTAAEWRRYVELYVEDRRRLTGQDGPPHDKA